MKQIQLAVRVGLELGSSGLQKSNTLTARPRRLLNNNDINNSISTSNNSKKYPDCRNPPCILRDRRKHICPDQSRLYRWHCLLNTDCWNRRSDEKVNNHLRSRGSPGVDRSQINVLSDPIEEFIEFAVAKSFNKMGKATTGSNRLNNSIHLNPLHLVFSNGSRGLKLNQM